jgi:hypothetical protein
MGEEGSFGAHARRRGRSLASGVAAANHDDVEARMHGGPSNAALLAERFPPVKKSLRSAASSLFHVKRQPLAIGRPWLFHVKQHAGRNESTFLCKSRGK